NWDATFALLDAAQDAGNLQPRMQVPENPDSERPADKDAGLLQSITENTQRVLTERSFESSKGPTSLAQYDEDRAALLPYAQDLARELNDQAPLSATTTRLVNLFRASGLDLDTFIDRLLAARTITQERTGSIRTRSEGFGPKPKMAYMLAVLEDLL